MDVMVTLLFFMPRVVPCTFKEMVQPALPARVPPDRLADPEPAVAVVMPVQVVVNPLGVATTNPAGRVSVNATPVRPVLALGLLIVKVNEVVALSVMLAAPNALTMVGGVACATVTLALEVFPVPWVEVTVTLLFFIPRVVPCTFNPMVQDALPARVPPDRLTEPEPAVAVVVPVHVVLNPLGVATTNPAGRVSVNATPVREVLALGLLMVKVNEVVPLSGMLAAPNALTMLGGVAAVVLVSEKLTVVRPADAAVTE